MIAPRGSLMASSPFKYFFDACAGIGCFHLGITLAVPGAGIECIGMAEIEDNLREIYRENFGNNFPTFSDVHLLSGTVAPAKQEEEEELERWKKLEVPRGTIFTAGFPCQPFSKSGGQLGIRDGMRGTVFDSLLMMMEEKKFDAFILENVENISGPRHQEDFQQMLKVLNEEYWTEHFIESPHLLDGDYALQHRQRVFICGLRKTSFPTAKDKKLSPDDRRTHGRKKDYAFLIMDQIRDSEQAKEKYTSSGGTITIETLRHIAKDLAGLHEEIYSNMKKQELLKHMIEKKELNGFTEDMISTGSTITAKGWGKLVEWYIEKTDKLTPHPTGFVERMRELRDEDMKILGGKYQRALIAWQEFLDKLPIDQEPCSPVWSMEFGKNYKLEDLQKIGTKIEDITGLSPNEKLPPYILSMFEDGKLSQVLPKWKKDFIKKNRDFYLRNKDFLYKWLDELRSNDEFNDTLQKFEWQCEPSTWGHALIELKNTLNNLGWNCKEINLKFISSVERLTKYILNQMDADVYQKNTLSQLLKYLKYENADNQDIIEKKFVSANGKKFRVQGIRILIRLLRKHGGHKPRDFVGNVVQFRPSGIRVSDSQISPALVAIGQIPYVVENLDQGTIYQLSAKQAAYLQGIDLTDPKFSMFSSMFSKDSPQLNVSEQFMRLGNAVNVELVKRIMYQLTSLATNSK